MQANENLNKLRVRSTLGFAIKNRLSLDYSGRELVSEKEFEEVQRQGHCDFNEIFDDNWMGCLQDISESAINYVAGVAAKKTLFRWSEGCSSCGEALTDSIGDYNGDQYHDELQRGGLNTPSLLSIYVTRTMTSIFISITKSPELKKKFLNAKNQKEVLCNTT